MRVLLGFRDAQLLHAEVGDVLAHGVDERLRLERDFDVGHRRVILRHADVVKREEAVPSLEALEVGVDKGSGDLTRSVGTEVVENHAVVRLDSLAALDYAGNDELVGNAVGIGILDCADGALRFDALAVYHCRICLFHALPAVISVHGVVSAHDGGDFAETDFIQLLDAVVDVVRRAGGRNVSAVEEGVDEYLFESLFLCKLHDAVEVGDVAVNAAG